MCCGYREALVCAVIRRAQRPIAVQRPLLLNVVGGAGARLYEGPLRAEHTLHTLPVQLVLNGLVCMVDLDVENICRRAGGVGTARALRLWQVWIYRTELQARTRLPTIAKCDCTARISLRLNLTPRP